MDAKIKNAANRVASQRVGYGKLFMYTEEAKKLSDGEQQAIVDYLADINKKVQEISEGEGKALTSESLDKYTVIMDELKAQMETAF